MLRFFTLAAITLVLLMSRAAGQDAKNYLLMPVTTDLQRLELGPDVTAYAAINGAALVLDGKIDPATFELPSFRKDLAALAAKHPGIIRIHTYYSAHAPRETEDFVDAGLSGIARRAGFEKVGIARTFSGSSWRWQEQLDSLAAADTAADCDEPVLHDDSVRVYPVRTRLTRWLTGNASAVVFVRQPFDGRASGLPDKARDSAGRFLGQLQLPQKGKLLVCISSTRAGEFSKEQFIERGAKELAVSLGFASSTVKHSPNGGAPESLLGKPAPEFKLAGLDGNEVSLHEAIKGRAALLTFWGVACAPCQQEAPHLSALHSRHVGAGFTVIAVNAYDESEEVVAKYVEHAKLTHPILLKGRQVAREQYQVGAYPTSFWIDHHGNVVDYVVGFDAGDEIYLAARAQRLLNERGEQ